MKKIIIVAVILIFCVSAFFIFSHKDSSDSITLYGNVDVRLVDISFQVRGVINEMQFDEGNFVKKGDLLAILDDRDFRSNHKKSKAEVKRLVAISENVNSIYNRNVDLCKIGATSQQDCTTYLNAKKEALASLESAVAAE
ncbi:MAG: biotin/lipoyl-binding protein, partial [Syntrophobacterales bacterium]|nr:biotin/lipoyl-binding protein [Syntrophobacterales bacterium]